MSRRVAFALLLSLVLAAPAAGQADPLPRIRQAYYAAVQDEAALGPAMQELRELRSTGRIRAGSSLDAALGAYRGALITLRAKHGTWPPTRLRHLRRGLAVMDSVAAKYPDHPEVRYLRLMSCYYLPGILGRGWSVREDFAALARLLPAARGDYPPDLYAAITRFVLEHGRLAAAQRRTLEAALASAGDA